MKVTAGRTRQAAAGHAKSCARSACRTAGMSCTNGSVPQPSRGYRPTPRPTVQNRTSNVPSTGVNRPPCSRPSFAVKYEQRISEGVTCLWSGEQAGAAVRSMPHTIVGRTCIAVKEARPGLGRLANPGAGVKGRQNGTFNCIGHGAANRQGRRFSAPALSSTIFKFGARPTVRQNGPLTQSRANRKPRRCGCCRLWQLLAPQSPRVVSAPVRTHISGTPARHPQCHGRCAPGVQTDPRTVHIHIQTTA